LANGVDIIQEAARGALGDPTAALGLTKKAADFVLDLIVAYVPTQIKEACSWLKGVLSFADPPNTTLTLQVYNSVTGELMLGQNVTSTTNFTYSSFGFWFSDPDEQIFVLSKDMANCTIKIVCSTTTNDTTSLPYTFFLLDPTFNQTTVTGSFLSPNEQTTATLTIGSDNRTSMDCLMPRISFSNTYPVRGDTITALVNVTDNLDNVINDADVFFSFGGTTVPATNLGNGQYESTIDTSNLNGSTVILAYAKEPSYLYGVDAAVLRVLVHDLGVDNADLSKTVVGTGYTDNITVTLTNYGGFTESSNLTVYANATAIGIQPIILASGNSTTMTFTWNTTGFAKGNYSISTYAWPVPGETDAADNNFTGGWVKVTIVGDVNGDGKVNLIDVFAVALAYGSYPGSPKWNPNYDINNDGKIDLIDYFIAALNYGKTDP
jgi:hypothetical protein